MITESQLIEKLVNIIVNDPDMVEVSTSKTNRILHENGLDPYDGSGEDHVFWNLLSSEQVRIMNQVVVLLNPTRKD